MHAPLHASVFVCVYMCARVCVCVNESVHICIRYVCVLCVYVYVYNMREEKEGILEESLFMHGILVSVAVISVTCDAQPCTVS